VASAEREPLMAKTRPLEPQSWEHLKESRKELGGSGGANLGPRNSSTGHSSLATVQY